MTTPSRELFGWVRCSHEGIGLPGCPICDPDPLRVLVRSMMLDNDDLRAALAAAETRVKDLEDGNKSLARRTERAEAERDEARRAAKMEPPYDSSLRGVWQDQWGRAERAEAERDAERARSARLEAALERLLDHSTEQHSRACEELPPRQCVCEATPAREDARAALAASPVEPDDFAMRGVK